MDLSKAHLAQLLGKEYKMAILPWGALEPHNLHLPYATDALLSQAIANEAVSKSGRDVLVLPPIWLGQQNPGQYDYPGCIHTKIETHKAILTDVVRSLLHQGFHSLLIINGHGGNSFKGLIRDLAFDFPEFKIYSTEWYTIVPMQGYFDDGGDHAGEQETSVGMHYFPELVDLSVAGDGKSKPQTIPSLKAKTAWIPRNWRETTDDTGIGYPKTSTAEKGRVYAQQVTDKLAQLIKEIC
ncbi:MAG: creatininase family protein [Rikenellaceae bacterium]